MKVQQLIKHIFHANNTPQEVALGVSVGIFIGFLPLYGLHLVLVLIAALLIRRANKIAILLGTNISMPLIIPFITWASYGIGRLLLPDDYPDLHWTLFKNFSYKDASMLLYPLFLGSIALGACCAVISYGITYRIARDRQRRMCGPSQAHH